MAAGTEEMKQEQKRLAKEAVEERMKEQDEERPDLRAFRSRVLSGLSAVSPSRGVPLFAALLSFSPAPH